MSAQAPKNDTFLRALVREPTPYTPVWIMRQAGRYLPEYNQTRQQAGSFLDLCKNPHLATEVTLQPLARFPLDAAILFSDILTIPDAMGLGLYFAEGEGPRFHRPLREEWEIRNLDVVDPAAHLGYVLDAVSQIRKALDNEVPLIGFSGSPYTLACYMIEGRGKTEFHEIKRMLYARPDLLHTILDVTAQSVVAYLNAQIEAGAQAVMIFDTWGGSLSEAAFREFSLAHIQRICADLHQTRDGQRVPRIVFTKGGGQWLEALAECGADALAVDWTTDLGAARRRVGDRVALQGNLDPAILLTTPDVVEREASRVLASFGHGNGHVFNLGHGVSQFTPPENVAALIDAVHALSPAYHQ
ncbi:MAG: uroporphyrinogen decarboxylase [Betaproteobacteria bacterium]|nr:MAG: uroporphyrinogen decarboxylase [Betaproteobacteria bacterium]